MHVVNECIYYRDEDVDKDGGDDNNNGCDNVYDTNDDENDEKVDMNKLIATSEVYGIKNNGYDSDPVIVG